MSATAADVPGRFDVAMNGEGYMLLDTVQSNLPFHSARATYSLSPTFIDRSNVSGAFGDNQQDWWLTAAQNDWSLGEEQKFFRQADATSRSRYWRGMNVDLSVPGQVTIARNSADVSFASAVSSIAYAYTLTVNQNAYFATGVTDLFEINANGDTVTNRGAHGAGGEPNTLVADGKNLFISGNACTLIRKWDGASFSTFSTSPAFSMAILNNTLYGFQSPSLNSFARWDSSGVPSTVFQWKSADGTPISNGSRQLAYGGRVLILRNAGTPSGVELWIYDGNGTSKVQEFEGNFAYHAMCVSEGVAFFLGFGQKRGFVRTELRYYASGSVGVAYTSHWTSTANVPTGTMAITPFGNGVIFTEPIYGSMMYYDLAQGGASSFAPFTASAATSNVAGSTVSAMLVNGSATGKRFLASEAASAASLQTSLFDFDSSLSKVIRAVKLDFDSASDGNGGSVDLFYTTNDVLSSFSSIANSITAGQEYPLNVNCRSFSLLAVLNKGTSTDGPRLKRLYVRAAPLLQQFRKREYVLDCSGDGNDVTRELRDGTPHPKSGREQVNDLITLAQSSTAFSITDRFGTYTGLIDLDDQDGFQIYEIHPSPENPVASGSFVVRVRVREV